MEIEFRKVTLADRDLIQGYYDRYQSRSCERCFVNVYLWAGFENITFAEIEGTLVIASVYGGKTFFAWPAGKKENIAAALRALEDYAENVLGEDLRLYHLTPAFFEILDELQPGRWDIVYSRNRADYVYDREKLANLTGKKYHGKRNHINRFVEEHPDWRYEPLSAENAADAREVAVIWRRENLCGVEDRFGCESAAADNSGKKEELCVCLNEIRLFDELALTGGILYAGDRPVAFTIGEKLSDDTFVVHIEKALADVQGAYPMINREFIRHECGDYTYINREDDAGEPGLRRAKMSYKPAFLEEKGVAVLKK